MSFRDDREAAHRRADALQQELQATRAELASLRSGGPRRGRRAAMAVSLVAVTVGALGAGVYVVAAQSAEADRARARQAEIEAAQQRVEAERRNVARLEELAAEARVRAAQDRHIAAQAAAEAEARAPVAEITWRASIDALSGASVSRAAPCTLTLGVSPGASGVRGRSLTIRCGDVELYRAPAEALRTIGLREGGVYGSEGHVYLLRFEDEAPAPTPRVRARISTLQHTVTLWRDGDTPLHATLFVRDVSEPRAGEAFRVGRVARSPAFAEVISRTARVTRVEGSTSVMRGDRCTFQLRPVWEFPETCRIALRCGSEWLYGERETGYLTCAVRDGRAVSARDENPSQRGGDPRLTWEGQRVTVSDFSERGAWSVDLAL